VRLCFLSGLKEIVGREEVEIQYTGRLSGLLDLLCERHGEDLRRVVRDPARPAEKNPFLKILVDGQDTLEGDPDLTGSETLFIFLPIAGG
jgi:hypothetical protein